MKSSTSRSLERQGDRGQEGDPDTEDVGQVKVTVILISLCDGVGHHPDSKEVSLIILIIGSRHT